MLKRWVFIVVVLVIPVSFAAAATEDTGPGCGLGQMIWQGDKGIIPQTLAATTNGTSMNQLFGITSGTLGCTNDGIVKNDQQVPVFTSVNFENLKQEMAQGQGEYLSSLASLLGVPAEQRGVFFAFTQDKYTVLFKSQETTSGEMLTALNQELAIHPVLSRFVAR